MSLFRDTWKQAAAPAGAGPGRRTGARWPAALVGLLLAGAALRADAQAVGAVTLVARRAVTPPGASSAALPSASTPVAAPARAGRSPVPFGPGERARYEVRLGPAVVGRGSIELSGVEVVRGRAAYRTSFRVRGGVPFYRVDDRLESWIDVETLASLRHVQASREGRRSRARRYEIYPERGVYTERVPTAGADTAAGPEPAPERPTVARPLDEGAFVQFVRTVPLVVGERHTFHDYFKPDRNPVTVDVLRRERVAVPAGSFDAVVIRPAFRTKGIFAESGGTEVWLSDDARRVVVRVRTHLPFGTLTLALTEYVPPDA
jgi:hypothetical protein